MRIPKAVAVESRLAEGTVVDMKLARGRVVLIPVRDLEPALEELLAGVTEENIHGEVDFWKPAGKEIW